MTVPLDNDSIDAALDINAAVLNLQNLAEKYDVPMIGIIGTKNIPDIGVKKQNDLDGNKYNNKAWVFIYGCHNDITQLIVALLRMDELDSDEGQLINDAKSAYLKKMLKKLKQ